MLPLRIITHRRPELLSGALFSWARALAARQRVSRAGSALVPEAQAERQGILVFDDSPEPAFQRANAAAAEKAAAATGVPVRLVSRRERESLPGSLPPESAALAAALRFGLGGPEGGLPAGGPGSNRNGTLLFSIGEKAVSVDDDAVFSFRCFKPGIAGRLAPGGGLGPGGRDLPVFLPAAPGRVAAMTEAFAGDPFESFEAVLGRSFDDGGPGDGLPEPLGPGHFRSELKRHEPKRSGPKRFGPVKIAMGGIHGGRWFGSPHGIFDVEPELQTLAWEDEEGYRAARENPDSLLLSPNLLLTERHFFVTTLFGFDARDILPPFFPGIRNEDGVWAFLVRCCHPRSPVCHLPLAVEHHRDSRRPFTPADYEDFTVGAGKVMLHLLHFIYDRLPEDEPGEILAGLGRGLSSCPAISKRNWRELITGLLMESERRRREILEARLEAPEAAGYWTSDLENHIRSLRKAALSAEPYRPREFLPLGRKGETAFRDYVARCGELLEAWPEIWAWAAGAESEILRLRR